MPTPFADTALNPPFFAPVVDMTSLPPGLRVGPDSPNPPELVPVLEIAPGSEPIPAGVAHVVAGTAVVEIHARVRAIGWVDRARHWRFCGEGSGVGILDTHIALRGPFCVEVLARPAQSAVERMSLLEGRQTPVSMSLARHDDGWHLRCGLQVEHSPKRGVTTVAWIGAESTASVPLDLWQTFAAAWDGLGLTLLVNGQVVGRRLIRRASIVPLGDEGTAWSVGAAIDGRREPYTGDIAGVHIHDGLPPRYVEILQTAADRGLGAIDSRYADLGGAGGFLGAPVGPEHDVEGGRQREYAGGSILWSAVIGAFAVQGEIWRTYRTGLFEKLGFPLGDETTGRVVGCRISTFQRGAVVWHPNTGACAVWGDAFVTWCAFGAETGLLGLPISAASNGDAGHAPDTRFQGGRVFQKTPTQPAFEVHGAILERYVELGERHGALGWPTSHEQPVLDAFRREVGRVSTFENGAIFWTAAAAFEVTGAFLQAMQLLGGPAGPLGFPTSAPLRTAAGTRQGFAGGVFVQGTAWAEPVWIKRLTLRLDKTVQAAGIDDWAEHTAELYGKVSVEVDGKRLLNNRRIPGSGESGSTLEYDLPDFEFVPHVHTRIRVDVEFWDWDAASGDDKLGVYNRTFQPDKLWDLQEGGMFVAQEPMTAGSSDADAKALYTHIALSANKEVVDKNSFREKYWWPFANPGTPELSRALYVEAFRDVAWTEDAWDRIISPFDSLFYEIAFKDVAKDGNCFGISAEAFRAFRGVSPFIQPIHRYTGFPEDKFLRERINIRHAWQIGDAGIRWTVWNVLNHDAWQPVTVFDDARAAIDRDGATLISFYSLEHFVGHTVLAYDYQDLRDDPSEIHGVLRCADPNRPSSMGTGHICLVKIRKNGTFFTEGMASNTFPNGYATSSVLHGLIDTTFMFHSPWHTISSQPRLPFWEVLATLLSFGLLIFAGDAEVEQLSVGSEGLMTRGPEGRRVRPDRGWLPVPLANGPGGLGLWSSVAPPTAPVGLDLRGRCPGTWRQGFFLRSAALTATVPTSAGERDNVLLNEVEAAIPQLVLRPGASTKAAQVNLAVLHDPAGRERRILEFPLQGARDDPGTAQIDPASGALLLSPGGPARPVDITVRVPAENTTRVGVLRGVPVGTGQEVLRITADAWANPQGTFTVERLAGIRGAVLDRQVLQGTRHTP